MKAFANTIAITVMGVLAYSFCLLFPPFRDSAAIMTLLFIFAFGAIGAFLWQASEAWHIAPHEWAVVFFIISTVPLAIFFAWSWDIGLSPREAIFFPKDLWDKINFTTDYLKYKGTRSSLLLGIGCLIFGVGSFVREWIVSLGSPLTTRSTRTTRKREVG